MNVLTVSQVNTYIKALIDESAPLKNIYVGGEISNFTHYYRSGHMYFTIKDENSQLKCVMFSTAASKLRFQPENGMRVICRGRISIYEKSGEYQLYVVDMQPDGIGALNLAFEQLKQRLFDEGVCDESVKKPLPQFPRKIGVATSNIGAAIEDIKNITTRRYPLAEIVIAPTIVQGEQAAPDIVKSIKMLDIISDVDVIIVGRGGGSIEDLWAFNTEEVARAVIACKTPVVSAVGHESDFTICDFVADLRAPTPSAAAELCCPDITNLIEFNRFAKAQMGFLINSRIDSEFQHIDDIAEKSILSDCDSFLAEYANQISDISSRMYNQFKSLIDVKSAELAVIAGKLHALSPLAVLSRGYSVTKKNRAVINSVKDVFAEDIVTVSLSDGVLDCTVNEVIKNE